VNIYNTVRPLTTDVNNSLRLTCPSNAARDLNSWHMCTQLSIIVTCKTVFNYISIGTCAVKSHLPPTVAPNFIWETIEMRCNLL